MLGCFGVSIIHQTLPWTAGSLTYVIFLHVYTHSWEGAWLQDWWLSAPELDVPLAKFMHLVFPGVLGKSCCCWWTRSVLLHFCGVFWALINSLVCWFYTSALCLNLFQHTPELDRKTNCQVIILPCLLIGTTQAFPDWLCLSIHQTEREKQTVTSVRWS